MSIKLLTDENNDGIIKVTSKDGNQSYDYILTPDGKITGAEFTGIAHKIRVGTVANPEPGDIWVN